MLSEAFEKRLILVSGKGGVGKTTLSVLLALLAATQKKRTLLVEMNSNGNIAPLFNTTGDFQEEIPLAPYISGINLSPKKCFEEYVLKHLHFKSIYKTFFNNTFVNNFIEAVPGLNDILMLGKIYELEQQYKNKLLGQLAYDLIIVDAPSTGHCLSTLEVPQVLKSAVKLGPLHSHASKILTLLADKNKTIFSLVTLAEEMPVNESLEYIEGLKTKTSLNFGPIFINSVMSPVQPALSAKSESSLPNNLLCHYYTLTQKRAELNQLYIEEINKRFEGFYKIILPFQFNELKRLSHFTPLLNLLKEKLA